MLKARPWKEALSIQKMLIPIAIESTPMGTDNNNVQQRRNKPLCADFDWLSYFPFQVPLFVEGHPITDNVDTQKEPNCWCCMAEQYTAFI